MGTAVLYEEVCSTYTSTWCGEATLVPNPPPYASNTTVYVTPSPVAPTSTCVLPTPEVTTCPTPGTYTFPAATLVVTETTTVCGATTTVLPPGTHTYGGVTTSVVTETTITCPYATVSTSGSVTTSVILTTTYVCPSSGVYTIAPTTTTCTETETCVYPTVTSFVPGTYTHPAKTVTIVKTLEVFVCPYESSTVYVPPPSSVYTPAYTPPASSAPAYTPPASSAAPVSSAAKPKPSSYSNGNIVTKGNQWAMTYTPYTSTGSCKSASDVMTDIQLISEKGFTTVRVYSTDCSGLQNIGAACEAYGMKMIIGIFIDTAGIAGAQAQVTAITSWGKWELVSMIVVGNEAIFNGYCSATELAAFIVSCRQSFQNAGCPSSIPITTTEPVNILQEHGADLCYAIDVMASNIQSFFNSGVTAAGAGDFVKSQLAIVAEICPEAGKKGCYNLESGWPSAGNVNGAAIPGVVEQKIAITSILETCGTQSVIFSFQNDLWKEPGSLGVEQSWGCAENL